MRKLVEVGAGEMASKWENGPMGAGARESLPGVLETSGVGDSSPSPATNLVRRPSNQVPKESRLGFETLREIHDVPDLSI